MCDVLIVDDDPASAAATRSLLQRCPVADRLRIHAAPTIDDDTESPDIAIVDIQLADGESGVDLVSEVFPEGSRTQVIYATGYIEYCTDVYRTEHVSFLVKPIRQADLDAAMDRAIRNVERLKNSTISVAFGRATCTIDVPSIEYIESNLRKIVIHTTEGVFSTYESLDSMTRRLPASFVRCHKSFLVNMSHVRETRAKKLVMRSGAEIPVSRSHGEEVRARLVETRGLSWCADMQDALVADAAAPAAPAAASDGVSNGAAAQKAASSPTDGTSPASDSPSAPSGAALAHAVAVEG